MSYLTTGLDLKLDALSLAGEPGDGTSSYTDQQVYEWLTVTQRAVVAGGTFGPSFLLPESWYWARAWPRGAIQLVQPYNQAGAFSGTFSTGSQQVIVIDAAMPDLTGYRIMEPGTATRHIIDSTQDAGAVGLITLREPWTGVNETTTNWVAYPDTYRLPTDFIRGQSPLFLYSFPTTFPGTQVIDVVDPAELERHYPQTFPWGGTASPTTVGGGFPLMAARVTDTRLRFSHFLNTPNTPQNVQIEFEYLQRPNVIAEGTIPSIPIDFRRILSYGAAYLILDDKKSSQMDSLLQHFMDLYKAMRDAHARDMRRMSTRWGVIQPARAGGNWSFRLTESGLPVYVW
jgi:hypothetical protein